MRTPRWSPHSFLEVIPQLKDLDEATLVRVGIEGASVPFASHHITRALLMCHGGTVSTGRYDSLLRRQQADLAVFASDEAIDISPEIDYECVQGLSNEIKERLKKIRPANIVSRWRLSFST